jgi:hypothetical protein
MPISYPKPRDRRFVLPSVALDQMLQWTPSGGAQEQALEGVAKS